MISYLKAFAILMAALIVSMVLGYAVMYLLLVMFAKIDGPYYMAIFVIIVVVGIMAIPASKEFK